MNQTTYICDKNSSHYFTRLTNTEPDKRLSCASCDGWMHPVLTTTRLMAKGHAMDTDDPAKTDPVADYDLFEFLGALFERYERSNDDYESYLWSEVEELEKLLQSQRNALTEPQPFEVANYKRLMALEAKGIEEYREMRTEPALSPEALVSFINQLSPWNLKTTGLDVLKAYTEKVADEARNALLEELEKEGPEYKLARLQDGDSYGPHEAIETFLNAQHNATNSEWRTLIQSKKSGKDV